MDSGFGGLSLVADLLGESYNLEVVYFLDWENKPYGSKSKTEVRILVETAAEVLFQEGVEAILLACNTATSVAVESLRKKYHLPIFGMEPAIKPALESSRGGEVGVLATELTLREDRFLSLKNRFDPMNRVHPMPCPGLADMVDREDWISAREYLQNILLSEKYKKIFNFVLGCTHYVFLEETMEELRPDCHLFHGNRGTVRHLMQTLDIPRSQDKDGMREYPGEIRREGNELVVNSQSLRLLSNAKLPNHTKEKREEYLALSEKFIKLRTGKRKEWITKK